MGTAERMSSTTRGNTTRGASQVSAAPSQGPRRAERVPAAPVNEYRGEQPVRQATPAVTYATPAPVTYVTPVPITYAAPATYVSPTMSSSVIHVGRRRRYGLFGRRYGGYYGGYGGGYGGHYGGYGGHGSYGSPFGFGGGGFGFSW